MFVAFTDGSESTITAVFSSTQDSGLWPYQGEIDVTDARYESFYKAFLLRCSRDFPPLSLPNDQAAADQAAALRWIFRRDMISFWAGSSIRWWAAAATAMAAIQYSAALAATG
ncbi:hypothetical protein B0G75_104388 [Paraburkholderia sp. BL18I3N2]|nr:hypothetical protein B0G75_104388 [Paraburkholderia sp. BL18I3N2]